jgi:hypothetical protein
MSLTESDTSALLERLARIGLAKPRFNRIAVEQAMRRHLREADDPSRPIQWLDAVAAYRHAFRLGSREIVSPALRGNIAALKAAIARGCKKAGVPSPATEDRSLPGLSSPNSAGAKVLMMLEASRAASDAAWRVAERPLKEKAEQPGARPTDAARWEMAKRRRREALFDPLDRALRCITLMDRCARLGRRHSDVAFGCSGAAARQLVRIWEPIIDCAEAGLFRYWITAHEVICVPRPALSVVFGRLHREDGPAVRWASGRCHWFWHGIEVPGWLIEEPGQITAEVIRAEGHAEVRRCMVELWAKRLTDEPGAELVSEDECGRLWRCQLGPQETYALVEVTNGTVEPDGTRRRYHLRVPAAMRTAREAVAWTYGLSADDYQLVART